MLELKLYMDRIRTRFAPSPTGSMHIGNLRTALYAYALAKHSGGDFILRIENTDKKREKAGGIEEIKNLLGIFGISWDEYYVQSERLEKYQKAAHKLVAEGHAFYCQCSARNAKEQGFSSQLRDPCREKGLTSGAIKLKVPEREEVSFDDFVLGKKVVWDSSTVADTTLLKSDGFPTYHLAVVVDDTDMQITHVLRGHDWLPSTPVHLLVYKHLGFTAPQIGHLTDILDPDGGKLSKRKGSTSCGGLIEEGYLPEAILNFIMLLGWAPKDNRELFTLEEFVKAFDPNGFQKSNPTFNHDKLDWFNGEYIRKLTNTELSLKLKTINSKFGDLGKNKQEVIAKLVKDRIVKLSDFNSLAGFFFESPKVDKKLLGGNCERHLSEALEKINNLKEWNLNTLNSSLMEIVKDKGYKTGDFFMDLRIAICGSRFTLPVNDSIIILGKEETTKRIRQVLSF